MKQRRVTSILLAAAITAPLPILAQSRFVPGAFEDPVARQLYSDAYDRWHALDTTVASYTALIRQRVAGALRTPLRDRVVYSNEHAVRTWWRRGARPVTMVLGNRTRHPGRDFALSRGEADRLDAMPYAEPFSPGDDHLLFGWNREDEVGPPGADGRAPRPSPLPWGRPVLPLPQRRHDHGVLPRWPRRPRRGAPVRPLPRGRLSADGHPVDRSRVGRADTRGVPAKRGNGLRAGRRRPRRTGSRPRDASHAGRFQAGGPSPQFRLRRLRALGIRALAAVPRPLRGGGDRRGSQGPAHGRRVVRDRVLHQFVRGSWRGQRA